MTLSSLSVQRHKSLYEQTYDALRASILSGELSPGQHLVETQLAEQLQVSRTPIREAMRQLQRDTLIIAAAGGGLQVATLSAEDVGYLYDCRLALEQLAVQGACIHATATQLSDLETLVVQAEQFTSHDDTNQYNPQMLDLDYHFHRLIAESSGNHWLVSLLDRVFDKMTLLRVQTTRHNPQVLEVRSEHRDIYQAILQSRQSGEAASTTKAVQAVQTHLESSRARVTQEVFKLQHEQQ